jgi:hypothetical protein
MENFSIHEIFLIIDNIDSTNTLNKIPSKECIFSI